MSDPLELFKTVLAEFHDDTKWDKALFHKIKTISNTKVGSVGQAFIERLCAELSMPCSFPFNAKGERVTQSPWDIKIANIEFELKTATEDTNNNFQFNHIRYHRKYQALLCLGVSPENLYFGVWSKGDVTTGKAGNLVSMEKSANASYKLTKAPKQLFKISAFKKKIKEFSEVFK
jgi:hypothetical protein